MSQTQIYQLGGGGGSGGRGGGGGGGGSGGRPQTGYGAPGR